MKRKIIPVIILAAGFALFLNSCKKELNGGSIPTNQQILITSYVEGIDSLKTLTALLKRDSVDNILNTYGALTLFAPTDRAFTSYLASLGKNSINDLTDAEVKYLINYHILTKSVVLKALNNGLVSDTTVNGLNVLYLNRGGYIIINKVAKVLNIAQLSNGYVYIVNTVLDPPAPNIYDYLDKSGKFTIMTQVFEQTGLKDTLQTVQETNPYTDLNYPLKLSFTLFAESDDVLKNNGITSFDALKQAVVDSSKNWTTDENVALKAFAQYHLASGLKFLYQMYKVEDLVTLALNRFKVIRINGFADGTTLPKLNADSTNGNLSGGISFIDAQSDKIVKNGVVQQLDGILYVPNNAPRAITIVRECEHGGRVYYTSLGLAAVLPDANISNGTIDFQSNQAFTTDEITTTGYGAVRFTPNDIGGYIEFVLKDIPVGKYQVRLNYQRDRSYASRNVNVYFRAASDTFNYKSLALYPGLDMANVSNTAPVDPDFNQQKLLGTVTIIEYGDYLIRFAHADLYYGTYDSIYLIPVN